MSKLRFCYSTIYKFDAPIVEHHFKVKCMPKTCFRQKINIEKVNISTNDFCSEAEDSFENKYVYGDIRAPHTEFVYEVTGTAEINSQNIDTSDKFVEIFKMSTELTAQGDEIKKHIQYLQEACAGMGDVEKYCYINNYVNHLLRYEQWQTDVKTTAEEALRLQYGVCQDYSHIMISILRGMNIAARYVVGMMIGEGYSHAWVEVYTSGDDCFRQGWYGFDPTNNKEADDTYIKISHGRDYDDSMVVRGMFKGIVSQQQMVRVNVEEVE
ncbi:MAG: transglutaminase domain-containing protein [Coprococcus sp.]